MLVTLTKESWQLNGEKLIVGMVLSELANRFHDGKDDRKKEISVSLTLRCELFVKSGVTTF